MRFGSLFAGIGGIDLGLERAGMECVWQVEIDEFCLRVLERHWSDVPKYKDVRDVGKHNLEAVDLIAGGFPCQPVSSAGRKKAQSDSRWLWPEFARVVSDLQPRYVFVENVPGLLGRGLGDILVDLAALGYDAEWDSIPAAAIGSPHCRYRVFLVAYPNSARELQQKGRKPDEWGWIGDGGLEEFRRRSLWAAEPDVGRVAYGVPLGVDRIRALGNAVVPQLAEWVGGRILAREARLRGDG